MPATDFGATHVMAVALNCRPCTLSVTHCPSAVTSSPSQTACVLPTSVNVRPFANSNAAGAATVSTV